MPERIGNRYEAIYPYDSFEAADGSLVIGAGNDKLFKILCAAMDKPELLEDKRFDCNNSRVLNHAELKPIIEDWLRDKKIDETVDRLLAAGIPAAPINTIDRVAKDPHIAEAREMFVEIDHPKAGRLKMTGNQIKLSNNKINTFRPAPLLSQDTEEILCKKLGMTEEDVDRLREEQVI